MGRISRWRYTDGVYYNRSIGDERQRWFQDYFQELPDDDLKTFRSDSAVIGDLSFRTKLASVMRRFQIRRGRPCKNKEGQ